MPEWLQKPLRRVRRHLMARRLVEGMVLALVAGGMGMLHLSYGGGAWMVLAVWGVWAYLVIWISLGVAEAAEPETDLARRVERAFPSLDSSLLNAVAFAGDAAVAADPLMHGFASAEIRRAEKLMGDVRAEKAVDWDRPGRFGLVLALFVLLNVVTAFTMREKYLASLETLFSPLAQMSRVVASLRGNGGEGGIRDILADLSVEVNFPAYTGLPAQRVTGGDGTVTAMLGSTVKISARSLESIDEASLEIFSGGAEEGKGNPSLTLQAEVSGGRVVTAQFTVTSAGSYRFQLDGEPSRYYAIQINEDQYPQVNMVEPASEIEVTPDERVEVVYNANDDFGLSYIDVVVSVGGKEERRRVFEPTGAKTAADGAYGVELAALGIQEDDEDLSLFLEAADNDTVSGPKISRSGQILLTLRSTAKIHAALLEDQERLLYGMVDWLGGALEDFPLKLSVLAEGLVKKYGSLDEAARRVLDAFPQILMRMQEDELADYNVYVALQNMNKELRQVHHSVTEWAGSQALTPQGFGGPPSAVAEPLSEKIAAEERPLEKHISYLDRLLYKQRLDDSLRTEEDILAAKDRLAELIEQYKNTQDPELREKILKEMAKLREQISEAMSKLSRLYEEMPDEFLNPKVKDALDDKSLEDLGSKLSRALESGDLDAALPDFENFLNQVDQMLSGMRESSGNFASEEFMKDLAKIQEAEAEAAKLERMEEKILEQTQKVQEQASARSGEDKVGELLKETKSQLDKAREQMAAAQQDEEQRIAQRKERASDPQAATNGNEIVKRRRDLQNLEQQYIPRSMEAVGQAMENLKENVDRLDLQAAEGEIVRAMTMVEQMEQRVDNSQKTSPQELRQSEPDSRPELEKSRGALQKALQKLREASQSAQPQLSESEKQQLSELAKQQSAIRDRTGKLSKELEEMAANSPMIDSRPGEGAREAAQQMKEAGDRLGQGQPSGAIPSAAGAKASLSQVREQLSEMRERMQQAASGQGAPLPMMGGFPGGRHGANGTVSDPRAKVDVPDENARKVPAEFREEIIKSMKEPSPPEYEPLNDEYYRRLIR